jgi:hypothetical protein
MSQDDRVRRLEGEIDMVKEVIEHMVNLSQTGLTMETDPLKPADMSSISYTYLKSIRKYGNDALLWMKEHGTPKQST